MHLARPRALEKHTQQPYLLSPHLTRDLQFGATPDFERNDTL